MKVKYDDEADALYIPIWPGREIARSMILDDERTVDLDVDDRVIGVELLFASKGVRLHDLAGRFDLHMYTPDFRKIEMHRFRAKT